MALELSGLEDKVAVITGAGRRRSIGRSVALELAKAGCDIVITGTDRDPSTFPDDEKAVKWPEDLGCDGGLCEWFALKDHLQKSIGVSHPVFVSAPFRA